MPAYYNEIDQKAAAWLRELIKQGHIADGVVDERSIVDIRPDELRSFTQCHFFAGVGVWSYALRCAGWPDDRPVWTGSCPCQPFSAAGKGSGFNDERHLWPTFHWLIQQCQPDIIFGEQVASQDGLGWLDLVQTDLENTGYASSAVDLCAAGFGAPHIRQRLYWVGKRLADTTVEGWQSWGRTGGQSDGRDPPRIESGRLCATVGMADANSGRECGMSGKKRRAPEKSEREVGKPDGERLWSITLGSGIVVGLADADGGNASAERQQCSGEQRQQSSDGSVVQLEHAARDGRVERRPEPNRGGIASGCSDGQLGHTIGARLERHGGNGDGAHRWAQQTGSVTAPSTVSRPGPTNGNWSAADWLYCRDGKWRPVEPGTFPLAHGSAERVGRLRGYGNAIVKACAQGFIEAYIESEGQIT